MQKDFIRDASLALDGFNEMSKVIEQTFGRDVWSKLLSRTAANGLPSYRPGDFVSLLSSTSLQAFSKAYDGFEKDRNVAIAQVKRLYLQANAFASWRVSKNVYATQISTVKGVPHSVVTIPESSAAHSMGYRYASIPNTELDHYLANGAMLASDANQRTSRGPVGGPACPDCGAAHAPGQNSLCHN